MRLETRKIYQFDELSEQAKQIAVDNYRNNNYELDWQDELLESLKAVFAKMDHVRLKDYQLGLCSYSYITTEFTNHEDIGDLAGKRAIAWLENNLLYLLRIGHLQHTRNRKNHARYGGAYRVGQIEPCALTGYCADDDFINHLIGQVACGCTLKNAFDSLADKYIELLQSESDYQNSAEYIVERLKGNDEEYLVNGSTL